MYITYLAASFTLSKMRIRKCVNLISIYTTGGVEFEKFLLHTVLVEY